jgi:hypothetical protein
MKLQIDLSKTQLDSIVLNYLYDKILNCSNRHNLMYLVLVYFSLKIDIDFSRTWDQIRLNAPGLVKAEINQYSNTYWNGVKTIKTFIIQSPSYLPLRNIAKMLHDDFYNFVLSVGNGEKILESFEDNISKTFDCVDSEHF